MFDIGWQFLGFSFGQVDQDRTLHVLVSELGDISVQSSAEHQHLLVFTARFDHVLDLFLQRLEPKMVNSKLLINANSSFRKYQKVWIKHFVGFI